MQLVVLVPDTVEEMTKPPQYVCIPCAVVFTQGVETNEQVQAHSDSLGHLIHTLIKDKLPIEGDWPETQEELKRLVRERQNFHIHMEQEN